MRLLIAEDQPTTALILRRLLERLGHEVTVARDGAEAWQIWRESSYPILISDWMMPGLDGPALCRKIRETRGRHYTYVILLTSKQTQDDRLEGLRAGADDFLVKPPDAQELAVRLEIAQRILAVQDELERRNAMLARLARHDELTGVSNRRQFRESLDAQFRASSRFGEPLSLLMVDVDHFKMFNDAFGHPAGDEVLRTVAAVLSRVVGDRGEVARYGGEEFAVILAATGPDGAVELGEQIRRALASEPWPLRGVTASIGASTVDPNLSTMTEMVEQADRALYRSKRSGRDRVSHDRQGDDAAGSPTEEERTGPAGALVVATGDGVADVLKPRHQR